MILIVDFSKKSDKERLYETLKGLKLVPYQVELKVYRNNRSNQQNAYYWGVVVKMLSDYTGFTPDEMHEYLRGRFLKYIKPLPGGEMAEIRQSTTDLDTKEFELYLEQIRMFAVQDLDIQIPLPNEIIEL
jgi:hypothetical protein